MRFKFKLHYQGFSRTVLVMLSILCVWTLFGQEESTESSKTCNYIRSQVKTEFYGEDNSLQSKEVGIDELWTRENEAAQLSNQRVSYLNTGTNQLIIIDLQFNAYISTSLPLKLENILQEGKLLEYQKETITGTVTPLKETRVILGLKCQGYQVTMIRKKPGSDPTQDKMTVWATTDVPFDIKPHDQLLDNLRILYNRDEKLRGELKTIKGLQMRIENPRTRDGKEITYISEVVEISRKLPPYNNIDEFVKAKGLIKVEKLIP